MAIERTFSIIKPDATKRNLTGAINAMIEAAGLRIVAQKRVRMSREEAETFYAVHRERPFFSELVETMTSGPVVVQVLEGKNAIRRKPSREPSASCTRARSARTRCTAPMPRRRQEPRSRSSSRATRSSADVGLQPGMKRSAAQSGKAAPDYASLYSGYAMRFPMRTELRQHRGSGGAFNIARPCHISR
jgi:nucleoside diphosphate kinase